MTRLHQDHERPHPQPSGDLMIAALLTAAITVAVVVYDVFASHDLITGDPR